MALQDSSSYGSGLTPFSGAMLDSSSVHKILSNGNRHKLLAFFQCRKQQIHDYLLGFLGSQPPSLYQEFILTHSEGQGRINIYLDSFEAALSGKVDRFLEDQKKIGYVRAMEGYHLNDVYSYTVCFKDALWRASQEYNQNETRAAYRLNIDDIFLFNKLLDGAYYLLSLSFLETRDEIIMRHREQLQALQRFAAGIVSVFEEERIWAQTTQGVFDVFGLTGTFILIDEGCLRNSSRRAYRMIGLQVAQSDLEKVLEGIGQTAKPTALDRHNTLVSLSFPADTDPFRLVASPIMDPKNNLIGVLCVHDQGRLFPFPKFDQNLLLHFSFFTGAVSANCRMVSEIAENRMDLRNLTARLISVQEKERKKIAADIHDVLTQALTGIGYKALYCMEVAGEDAGTLHRELELLTDTVNDALRQSRQIISNLRPHILDDIGVIAAFRKLIGEFGREFGLETHFYHPEQLQIDPDKGIALFRILQEALHNTRRHASASQVDLTLRVAEDETLVMTVKDNGCGFDMQKKNRSRQKAGLGLLTMRERAEDIGGTFQMRSSVGRGCEISVSIPLGKVQNG